MSTLEDAIARHPVGKAHWREPRVWSVRLPYTKPPITANMRLHHMRRAQIVGQIRRDAATAYRAARIPPLGRVIVELHWVPKRGSRAERHNLAPTLKAAVDALTPQRATRSQRTGKVTVHVGAGVIQDDADKYVISQECHIDPPNPEDPHLYVIIREVPNS